MTVSSSARISANLYSQNLFTHIRERCSKESFSNDFLYLDAYCLYKVRNIIPLTR